MADKHINANEWIRLADALPLEVRRFFEIEDQLLQSTDAVMESFVSGMRLTQGPFSQEDIAKAQEETKRLISESTKLHIDLYEHGNKISESIMSILKARTQRYALVSQHFSEFKAKVYLLSEELDAKLP